MGALKFATIVALVLIFGSCDCTDDDKRSVLVLLADDSTGRGSVEIVVSSPSHNNVWRLGCQLDGASVCEFFPEADDDSFELPATPRDAHESVEWQGDCSGAESCTFPVGEDDVRVRILLVVDPIALGQPPDTADPAAPSQEAADVSGDWKLLVDVTEASGVCASEKDDPPCSEGISIGGPPASLIVTGIGNAPDDWPGSFIDNKLTFGGKKSDGSGATAVTMILTYDPATDTLTGDEEWSWSGAAGTCLDSLSKVTGARRLGRHRPDPPRPSRGRAPGTRSPRDPRARSRHGHSCASGRQAGRARARPNEEPRAP